MSTQAERRTATIGAILASARALFDARGFEGASIDDIAERAGVAKGAVYHHFESKEALFTRVLEDVQAEILAAGGPPPPEGLDWADRIAEGVLHYLLAASAPGARRILLLDGPAVVGWLRWREIDDRYFSAGGRAAMARLLGESASPAEVEAHARLVMGAVMEAALTCATAEDPGAAARDLTEALRRTLKGLLPRPAEAPAQ
jgi:AcrR family transcriptional regulator